MGTVCVDENLVVSPAGVLSLTPFSVPRLVADAVAQSTGDGPLLPEVALPGKLMIDASVSWTNDNPLDSAVLLRVQRSAREWVVSNPNAIQIRDRWSSAINKEPDAPITTSVFNSQVGSAVDLGTNSVAQPVAGKYYGYADASLSDEWLPIVGPGDTVTVRYRAYVWTPPPFSDNGNNNAPEHSARVRSVRLQLTAVPQQGTLVAG